MSKIIIKNLFFSYDEKIIFQNFNIEVEQDNFTFIVGLNGSGKTTLCKIIESNENYEENIFIDNLPLNKSKINISIIYNEMPFLYGENGRDYIYLANSLSIEDTDLFIKKISHYFDIDWLDEPIYKLDLRRQQLLYIFSKLNRNIDFLILDEPFSYLDEKDKKLLFHFIKEANIATLIFTSNIEDVIYGDKIYVLHRGKIKCETTLNKLDQNEKILKKVGFSLPFMIDLSKKLKYYGLIDETILNQNELVDNIWKI